MRRRGPSRGRPSSEPDPQRGCQSEILKAGDELAEHAKVVLLIGLVMIAQPTKKDGWRGPGPERLICAFGAEELQGDIGYPGALPRTALVIAAQTGEAAGRPAKSSPFSRASLKEDRACPKVVALVVSHGARPATRAV